MNFQKKYILLSLVCLVVLSGCSAIPTMNKGDNIKNPYTKSGEKFVKTDFERIHMNQLSEKKSFTVSAKKTKQDSSDDIVKESTFWSKSVDDGMKNKYYAKLDIGDSIFEVYYNSNLSEEVVFHPQGTPQFKSGVLDKKTKTHLLTGAIIMSEDVIEQSDLKLKNTTKFRGTHVTVYQSTAKNVVKYPEMENLTTSDYSLTIYVSDEGIIRKYVKEWKVSNVNTGKTYTKKKVIIVSNINNTKLDAKPNWIDAAVKRTNATYVNSPTVKTVGFSGSY